MTLVLDKEDTTELLSEEICLEVSALNCAPVNAPTAVVLRLAICPEFNTNKSLMLSACKADVFKLESCDPVSPGICKVVNCPI